METAIKDIEEELMYFCLKLTTQLIEVLLFAFILKTCFQGLALLMFEHSDGKKGKLSNTIHSVDLFNMPLYGIKFTLLCKGLQI